MNVTTKELLWLIDNNHMKNCNITGKDVKIADEILGPTIVGLKGKTVQRPEQHVRVEISPLPDTMLSKYSQVELGADIMYVNGIRFFITVSRHIQFGTVEMILNSKAVMIVNSLTQVKQLYSK